MYKKHDGVESLRYSNNYNYIIHYTSPCQPFHSGDRVSHCARASG